jgi:hypothetical protein
MIASVALFGDRALFDAVVAKAEAGIHSWHWPGRSGTVGARPQSACNVSAGSTLLPYRVVQEDGTLTHGQADCLDYVLPKKRRRSEVSASNKNGSLDAVGRHDFNLEIDVRCITGAFPSAW